MTHPEVFSRNTVLPAWTYRANGVIWRLLPTTSGVFVGELRDPETKRTSFFCVNQQSGDVLWERISLEEQWWIGVEAVHDDRVFLHGFSTPDMPDHKGITALDLFTGKISWQNPDLRFVLCVDNSLFASKDGPDGRTLLALNYRTGELVQTCDSTMLESARARPNAIPNNVPEFPTPFELSDSMDEHAVLLHKHCAIDDVVGSVEALKINNLLFFNYHSHSNNNDQKHLKNTLNVLDLNEGHLVFTEILNNNAAAPTPDSFFVHGGMLYFIKDRSSLTAVSIAELSR